MIALPTDKYKPASLDKMITLIASLVEKSRDNNMKINLSETDYEAVATGKVNYFNSCPSIISKKLICFQGFPFLYQQIKDNINLHQTRNLIHSLSRNNNSLAQSIISMISQAISRHSEVS